MLEIDKLKAITTGKGGKVAIIDSGVDEFHPEIYGKVIVKLDRTREGFKGGDHGTFVAGEIAGSNVGLFPEMEIGDYKALTAVEGLGNSSWVARCIWDCMEDGFEVANASLGSQKHDEGLYSALRVFLANGKRFFIAASGNDGQADGMFTTDYPASYDINGLISVGACGLDGSGNLYIPVWSSSGKVTVVAPGVEILGILPNRQYGILSGTSMAAPLIASMIAAAKTLDPDFGHAKFDTIIHQCATDVDKPGYDGKSGHGIISVFTFLSMVAKYKDVATSEVVVKIKKPSCIRQLWNKLTVKKEVVNTMVLSHNGKDVVYKSIK